MKNNLKNKIHRSWWYVRLGVAKVLFGDLLRSAENAGWEEGFRHGSDCQ